MQRQNQKYDLGNKKTYNIGTFSTSSRKLKCNQNGSKALLLECNIYCCLQVYRHPILHKFCTRKH